MAKKKRPAPRHPPGPEAKLKAAMRRTFGPIARQLSAAVADNNPARVHTLRKKLNAALDSERFDDMVRVAAVETADSARRQVAKILGLNVNDFDPDMDAEIDRFLVNLHDVAAGAVVDLLDRAEELLDEGEDLTPEEADDGMLGAIGSMLAGVSMAFTFSFAKFNQTAQEDAGVDEYVWVSLHDDRVRSEHEHLDGIRVAWDDPPLSGDESSSGDDCHAGDDYNCRCVASPVLAEVIADQESDAEVEQVEHQEAA